MTNLVGRLRPLWFLLIIVLGCDGGPSGPSSGSLRVTVIGLPTGSSAAITVSGPGGFSQPVTATQTLTQLTPGTYSIAAADVSAGTTYYSATPPNQTVAVNASDNPATASVTYATATGALRVTITGLGTASAAAVTVTGPDSYNQSVTTTTTLTGLTPGSYTVTAQDVSAFCGTSYTASPATQGATVTANTTTTRTVSYSPPTGASVNLCIDGMYLTQSAQNYSGTVPLVQNRDAYLRVFAIADGANAFNPTVRVRYYSGLLIQDSVTITRVGATSVPTAPDESSLSLSWNVQVPASLIQPGLRIEAEVDPEGLFAETNEGDNVYPAAGPLTMSVRSVPTLNITFVQVVQTANGLAGDVGDVNALLDMTRRMHPLGAVNVAVRPTPVNTATTLAADGQGWSNVLLEVDAARVADASTRYYYGVVKVSYSSGVAGVAYVSNPGAGRAALGWDHLPSGSIVAAHELGHNWTRNHAPCGGPAGLDSQYPHSDGRIGVYGVDLGTPAPTLKQATTSDIMGYCDPKWISDYTYQAVLNYLAPSPLVMDAAAPVQPSVMVWGHIRDGELVLEPAFQLNTRPRLPARSGPYSVVGRADDGSPLFSLSFAPTEIADAPGQAKGFVFALPLSSAKAARLSNIRLTGKGREAILTAADTTALSPGAQFRIGGKPDSVEVRRVGVGRIKVRWNAGAHPMVMVRDADTGEVLSFARGGEVELSSSKGQVDLVLSDGVKSRVMRVAVAP